MSGIELNPSNPPTVSRPCHGDRLASQKMNWGQVHLSATDTHIGVLWDDGNKGDYPLEAISVCAQRAKDHWLEDPRARETQYNNKRVCSDDGDTWGTMWVTSHLASCIEWDDESICIEWDDESKSSPDDPDRVRRMLRNALILADGDPNYKLHSFVGLKAAIGGQLGVVVRTDDQFCHVQFDHGGVTPCYNYTDRSLIAAAVRKAIMHGCSSIAIAVLAKPLRRGKLTGRTCSYPTQNTILCTWDDGTTTTSGLAVVTEWIRAALRYSRITNAAQAGAEKGRPVGDRISVDKARELMFPSDSERRQVVIREDGNLWSPLVTARTEELVRAPAIAQLLGLPADAGVAVIRQRIGGLLELEQRILNDRAPSRERRDADGNPIVIAIDLSCEDDPGW